VKHKTLSTTTRRRGVVGCTERHARRGKFKGRQAALLRMVKILINDLKLDLPSCRKIVVWRGFGGRGGKNSTKMLIGTENLGQSQTSVRGGEPIFKQRYTATKKGRKRRRDDTGGGLIKMCIDGQRVTFTGFNMCILCPSRERTGGIKLHPRTAEGKGRVRVQGTLKLQNKECG